MFDRILGKFLVDTGRITRHQLDDVIRSEDNVRVKLGVTAVSEKLMTIEQADEINALQASVDKRFGDLAVEKGYLTEAQVKKLLGEQRNEYLIFIQTLIENKIMGMEQIEQELERYQKVNGFMASEMDSLKSGDVERIVPIFLIMEDKMSKELFSIGMKTIYRLVDNHVAVDRSYLTNEIKADVLGCQKLIGMHDIFAGITGKPDSVKKMALAYTKEDFIDTKEDALDAICELINCINGMYATELSKMRIEVDMEPPVYYTTSKRITGDELYVLPITVCGEELKYIISFNNNVKVE